MATTLTASPCPTVPINKTIMRQSFDNHDDNNDDNNATTMHGDNATIMMTMMMTMMMMHSTGRGCYISEDEEFLIWVGEEDHLRIMAMRKGKTLNKVFDRLRVRRDDLDDTTAAIPLIPLCYYTAPIAPCYLAASAWLGLPCCAESGTDRYHTHAHAHAHT